MWQPWRTKKGGGAKNIAALRVFWYTIYQQNKYVDRYTQHEKDTSVEIKKSDFDQLDGQPISIKRARERYGLNAEIIRTWTHRELIKILFTRGRKWYLNERDVAYCAAVYHAKKEFYGTTHGVRFFNDDGTPYRVRYTDVAAYHRHRRRGEQPPEPPATHDPSINIKREDFSHIKGEITAQDATKKYGISYNFVQTSKWKGIIRKAGQRGTAVLLNEADVAYCAAVYHAKKEFYGTTYGVRFFDDDGEPYRAKFPQSSRIERLKRKEKKH